MRRWLITLVVAAAAVTATVLLVIEPGGGTREERQADYQRCVYESILGFNTADGKLSETQRAQVRERHRTATDCRVP